VKAEREHTQAEDHQGQPSEDGSLRRSKINRVGLPTGTPAPEFRVKILTGEDLSLEAYKGRRVMIVFSDPACGPCNELLPKLERLHQLTPSIEVLMISRGDAAANARKVAHHHLTFPVGLQSHWELSRVYGLFATPCAYLIDENGNIAAPPAVGSAAILNLLIGAAILFLLKEGLNSDGCAI